MITNTRQTLIISLHNTIDMSVNPRHETPDERDGRIRLTIRKLSTDRSRLRKEVIEQRKSLKELRKKSFFGERNPALCQLISRNHQ